MLSRQETTTLTENKVTNSMILKHFRPLVVVCMPSDILLSALVRVFRGMRLWVAVLSKIEETTCCTLVFQISFFPEHKRPTRYKRPD